MTRVEEISSTPRLSRLEKLVCEMLQMSPMISPPLVGQLRECLTDLPSKLSADESLQAWKLSYSIWNLCVDVTNNMPHGEHVNEDQARLRQIASDLLFLAGNIDGVDSSQLKIATFFYRTGVIWHKLKNFELAAVCFEKVTELMSKLQEEQERRATPKTKEDHEFMFDLFVARSQTAWELSHKALACSLLARARGLLVVLPELQYHRQLAENYFEYGKSLLTKQDIESQADAIKHLEQAFEICSIPVRCNSEEPEKEIIGSLKIKILRYLAAGHILRENYESVLKCLTFLKSAPEHPSTSYLAVKALAGLDRYEEAEKELFALIRQSAASIEACMSGIEIVLQDPNRLEAGKRAFLILQSRYPSNKVLPVRMLEYVLRRLPEVETNNKKRVELVLDIASNDDIVATMTGVRHGRMQELGRDNLNGNLPCKEQECIHALLWNSGSEHFQAKQYEICIKLFETSMLYLPRDLDGNLQRAKSLRVLCLCRLARLQYDRADEYVTEAEKIDPNIACAFLKFKIHLQTNNEAAAAEQVEKMLICPDFEPDYLVLASHEAMTCNYVKVAITALSKFLDLPREKRSTGTKDVVVIRNIVHLALQDPQHQLEALKYLKEAQAQLADVGFDKFFGSGNLGPQEANWFASTSWNQGLLTVNNQEWQIAADYFSCASDFYASLPESEENLRCLQKSLLLATSSLLASQSSGDECIRSASRMIDKCRKVHRALAMTMDPADMADDNSEIHLNLLAFDLKSRSKDYKSQLDILTHCSSLPGFEADYFLLMANQAGKTPGEGTEVAKTGYRLALKLVLNSTSPDYKLVAMIVRKLITLADQHCKDGPEVMAMYKQAKEILVGLSPGEYPSEELQWLVATAWNRAGLHVKFLRFSEAEPWMEMAVGIANIDPHMEIRKLSMIENLNEVRNSKNKQSSSACTDA